MTNTTEQAIDEIFNRYFPSMTVEPKGFTDQKTADMATWLLNERRDKFKQAINEQLIKAEAKGGIRALETVKSDGHGGGNWLRVIELGICMLKAQLNQQESKGE